MPRRSWRRRSTVHRDSWSATSLVTARAYERLMATSPYRPETDHVVVAASGEWVASCCVWWDEATGVALVEPVGCVEEHRRRGLATAASVSALTTARDLGATTGLVCPRADAHLPPQPMSSLSPSSSRSTSLSSV